MKFTYEYVLKYPQYLVEHVKLNGKH